MFKNKPLITPPSDVELLETSISTSWIDDNGWVHSISKDSSHDFESIKAHFEGLKKIMKGQKRYFVTYPDLARSTDVKTRHYLNQILPEMMLAQAFVTRNNMIRMGITIFFKLNKYVVPFKVFTEIEEAEKWLENYDSELS